MKRKQPRVSLVSLVEQDQLGELFETRDLPVQVARICSETIIASNAGALTLAGGRLRAIVEAICIDRKVSGQDLQKKIDDFVAKGLLAKPQADLLHEERYIGNAALHEILPPVKQEIEDELVIVEGLMNTIYILPLRAERLREKRQNGRKREVQLNLLQAYLPQLRID